MVVAADAKLAAELVSDEQRAAYEAYLDETRKASEIDRLSTDRPKTGVFLGAHAVNPVNGEQIPVYAADYVLADYGTGAIMAVPGPGPARLGLRQGVRPADRARRCSRPRTGRARRTSATGRRSTRPTTTVAGRPGGRRGQGRDHRLAGGAGHRQRRGQLPAARLAAVAAAVLGLPDPDRPLPGRAARSPSPTTSCRSCCRT